MLLANLSVFSLARRLFLFITQIIYISRLPGLPGGRSEVLIRFLEFKFVYIFSLQQVIHGLQTKGTDDTCILPIKSLSIGPLVAVKVAQEQWQAIDNKKL
jgi:hypothetical protein